MSTTDSRAQIDESTLGSPDSAVNDKTEDPENPSGEEGDAAAVEEEEEGECPFCLFMKGGGCNDSFEEWQKCVEEAEKKKEDVVSKCGELTMLLTKCMQAHSDYYEPLLRAEKAVEEEAIKQLQREAGEAEESCKKVAEETG